MKKSTIEALRAFYGHDIEFRISEKRDKIREEIQQMFAENLIQPEFAQSKLSNLIAAQQKLEKEILIVKSELKNAKKKFKRGSISRDELFETEFRLIELKSQLEEIIEKLKKFK